MKGKHVLTQASQKNENLTAHSFFDSFFSGLNSNAAGWGLPQEHPAHTAIIQQDTPATAVYYVESGLLKLSRIDRTGHEVIAGLRRRHWLIGAPAVLLGKQYSFTITTLVPCRLRSISAEKLLNLVETDIHFSRELLSLLSQEIFIHGKNFVNLGCLPAKDRLKRLLYELITELELPSDPKRQDKIQMPLKHREMAQMIAVTPEHLSRLLKALKHEGVIERDGIWLTVRNVGGLMAECKI